MSVSLIYLPQEKINVLNSLGNENALCNVKVGDESYQYTIEETAFISEKLFSHFQNDLDFTVDLLSLPFGVSAQSVKEAYQKFDSLFRQDGPITINQSNYKSFGYVASCLGCSQLKKKCGKANQKDFQFSLSSDLLSNLDSNSLQKFNNFEFKINQTTFKANLKLFQCISSKTLSDEPIQIDDSYMPAFEQFFGLFEGYPFNIKEATKNGNGAIEFLDREFELKGLFLNAVSLPDPVDLDSSLRFLSSVFLRTHQELRSKSIELIRSNIENLSTVDLANLSKIDLCDLLDIFSEGIVIPDEDFLANLILEIVRNDQSKIGLIQKVLFSAVSVPIIDKLLDLIQIDDITVEIFNAFKLKLLSEVTYSETQPGRWKSPPNFYSRSAIEKIIEESSILKKLNSDLSDQLKDLQKKYDELFEKSTNNFSKLEDVMKLIAFQRDTLEPIRNITVRGKTGLICELRKENFKNVEIVASSSDPSFSVENVIEYSKEIWKSQDSPNQSISYHFPKHTVSISMYSVQSGNENFPLSFTISGSNDGQNWTTVDEQLNIQSLSKPFAFQYFFIKKCGFFSYLKLTQTGKNSQGSDIFEVSLLEISGTTNFSS